ncbi:MAG: DUF3108 domain-containing protein [Pseudomonadota bacterium]
MLNNTARLVATLFFTAIGAHAAAQDVPAWQVDDFAVTYGAKVGIARGETRLEMRRLVDNEFIIESWTELRGIVSLFKRGTIYERARFDYVDGDILTRSFERRDDISGEDRNVEVDYDWATGQATVTYQGVTTTYPIEPGVSNTLVMQVELMQSLSTGDRPEWLDVVGHKGRLRFDVTYEGQDAIQIDDQVQELFCYSHSRRDSGIRTTFWAEPERSHLPLKARIEKNEKLRGQLTLIGDVASSTSRASD